MLTDFVILVRLGIRVRAFEGIDYKTTGAAGLHGIATKYLRSVGYACGDHWVRIYIVCLNVSMDQRMECIVPLHKTKTTIMNLEINWGISLLSVVWENVCQSSDRSHDRVYRTVSRIAAVWLKNYRSCTDRIFAARQNDDKIKAKK